MTAAPCESDLADRLVVILGSQRSGTTWLVQLFGGHGELAAFDAETSIFNGLWDLWENSRRPDGEGISTLLDPDQFAVTVRTFCDRIFVGARDRFVPWAEWFVEKTPPHVHCLPLMAAAYPDAWYIHLVRDGRDVAKSISDAPFGPQDLPSAAQTWAKAVSDVRKDSWLVERFTEIRYEDLFADPVSQMTRLFEWMGLEVDDEVRQGVMEAAGRDVSRYKTGPVGPGKWRQLPPADIRDIQAGAGDVLAELGYTD